MNYVIKDLQIEFSVSKFIIVFFLFYLIYIIYVDVNNLILNCIYVSLWNMLHKWYEYTYSPTNRKHNVGNCKNHIKKTSIMAL